MKKRLVSPDLHLKKHTPPTVIVSGYNKQGVGYFDHNL